ncbi:MAG: hypothetical protein R3C59_06945 [Planctomycetaceae bacterium]
MLNTRIQNTGSSVKLNEIVRVNPMYFRPPYRNHDNRSAAYNPRMQKARYD